MVAVQTRGSNFADHAFHFPTTRRVGHLPHLKPTQCTGGLSFAMFRQGSLLALQEQSQQSLQAVLLILTRH